MALTIGSLGGLIGSPVAGTILTSQSDRSQIEQEGALDFTGTLAFTGVMLMICGALMTVARVN